MTLWPRILLWSWLLLLGKPGNPLVMIGTFETEAGCTTKVKELSMTGLRGFAWQCIDPSTGTDRRGTVR
jgi:hypothetical protein